MSGILGNTHFLADALERSYSESQYRSLSAPDIEDDEEYDEEDYYDVEDDCDEEEDEDFCFEQE